MDVHNGLKRASVPAMTHVMQNHQLAVQYTPPTVANLDQILTILRPMQTIYSIICINGGDSQILLSFTAERQASGAADSGSEGRADAVCRHLHAFDTY